MPENNEHLICCLCMYSAQCEKELECHIDSVHADIFQALNPIQVTVGGPSQEPAGFAKQLTTTYLESQQTGDTDSVGDNCPPAVPAKRGRKSKAALLEKDKIIKINAGLSAANQVSPDTTNSSSIITMNSSSITTKAKRGRKSKAGQISTGHQELSFASNSSPDMTMTSPPTIPAKAKRGRKSKASQISSPETAFAKTSDVEQNDMPSGGKKAKWTSKNEESGMLVQDNLMSEETTSEKGELASDANQLQNPICLLEIKTEPQQQIDFFERLKTENENSRLQMRLAMEAERKAFLEDLQKSKIDHDTKELSFKELERNFDQVSTELEKLKCASKIENEKLKSDLEEATAHNIELEARLIRMSENYSKLQMEMSNGLEADVTRLKHKSEQDQRELDESRFKIEGLYDVIRKKTVQISQMKLDEERLELELKKCKSYYVKLQSEATNYGTIKKILESVFQSDEIFCTDVIGLSNDKFEDINDEEICSIIEFILTDYISTKEGHFSNLQFFNKKMVCLKSILQLREKQVKELTSNLHARANEVQIKKSDSRKFAKTIEMANTEREKMSKKLESCKEELQRAKEKILSLESGKKQIVHNLKMSLNQKDKIIFDLENTKMSNKSGCTKQQSETIRTLKNGEIYLKKNLADQRSKMREQQNLILLLQQLNLQLETAIEGPKCSQREAPKAVQSVVLKDSQRQVLKDVEKENLKLREEIACQSIMYKMICSRLEQMKGKVKLNMDEKEKKISQLEQKLQNSKIECIKMKKQLQDSQSKIVFLT